MMLKVHSVDYKAVSLTARVNFYRLDVVTAKICEKPRNSERIRTYVRKGSSKVIDLGVNQKRICNFLVVININFGCISHRFRAIDV